MKRTVFDNLTMVLFIAVLASAPTAPASEGVPPIADAGSSRYAAKQPVVLDGMGSYDPDESAPLSYSWRQTSGPAVVLSDASTATPAVSGFVQTDAIQECQFELVVSDGELASLPDTVEVIIVPDFGASTLRQENPPFDPDKPTIIYFDGGDCVKGGGLWSVPSWLAKANLVSSPGGPQEFGPDSYRPDSAARPPTYHECGDMIIVYLSSVAPNYKQPIQTMGFSTGGQPAIDMGIHLNLTYADARYAINHVTFLDVTCRDYASSVADYLVSSVDGEQCWLDAYVSLRGSFHPGALNVEFPGAGHGIPENWYRSSLAGSDMNTSNDGVIAGAYWSVVGPGKNLQLASTPDTQTYKFRWYGDIFSGYMGFYDEAEHPGRLPEPVALVGPADAATVDANGVVLSCEESENAVGYQLLFGHDPYQMVYLFSDTPWPPAESVRAFPFEQCWWTVKAYDQYGSTIYADPLRIHAETVNAQTIENVSTGQRYASIQQAINDAHAGDEIAVGPGACQYHENINFKGKNLIVRSTDPNDPDIVAATVINGGHRPSVVTFCGSEEASCLLAGFTITGGVLGIACRDASPTIRNCIIKSNGPNAIEFWSGYGPPTIIDCATLGQIAAVKDPRLIAHWALDETEGDIACDSAADYNGTLNGGPIWQPTGGTVAGALSFDGIDDYVSTPFVLNPAGDVPNTEAHIWVKGGVFDTEANIWVKGGVFSTFAWVKGGEPGQVIISQANGANWLLADPSEGKLMTELGSDDGLSDALMSNFVITDGLWHRVGLVRDGANRILYVDGVEVARDTQVGLGSSEGGLYFGAGKELEPGSFLSGLIDDVRIYNRAVRP